MRSHVFLSHNSADKPQVIRLARELIARGVSVWLDVFELRPADWFGTKLQEALAGSEVVLACIGENGKGPWHDRELQAARQAGIDVRAVSLPGWTDACGWLGLEEVIGVRLHAGWEVGVEALANQLSKRAPSREPAAPKVPGGPFDGNPYPGIDAGFEAEHAAWFFGREKATAEIVRGLLARRWVWLVGNSGSGKSSVARAGVMAWWPTATGRIGAAAVLEPSAKATEDLSAGLNRLVGAAGGCPLAVDEVVHLAANPANWSIVLRERFGGTKSPPPLLVVVDQAEQMFAEAGLRGTNQQVLKVLEDLANDEALRVYVLVVMRSDWLPRAFEEPALRPILERAQMQVALTGMDERSIRDAIEIPARRAGGGVARGVTEALVAGAMEHGLPILQLVLQKAWDNRSPTSDTIESVGPRPFVDAIGQRLASGEGLADTRLDVLAAALVELDDRNRPRRRFLSRLEVGRHPQAASLKSDLQALERARVIKPIYRGLSEDADRPAGDSGWQLAHETVLTAWTGFAAAVERRRDMLAQRAALARRVEDHRTAGADALLRGAELARFEPLRADPTLDDAARTFLDASIGAREVALQRERDEMARLRDTNLMLGYKMSKDPTHRVALLREFERPDLAPRWMDAVYGALATPTWHWEMPPTGTYELVGQLALNADGSLLACEVGSRFGDHALALWTVGTAAVKLVQLDGPVAWIGFLRDGMRVAVLSREGRYSTLLPAQVPLPRIAVEETGLEPGSLSVVVQSSAWQEVADLGNTVTGTAPTETGLFVQAGRGGCFLLDEEGNVSPRFNWEAHHLPMPPLDAEEEGAGPRVQLVARWGNRSIEFHAFGDNLQLTTRESHESLRSVQLLGKQSRSRATALAISDSGEHVAAGFEDGELWIWNLAQQDSDLGRRHETHAGVERWESQRADCFHLELGQPVAWIRALAGGRFLLGTRDGHAYSVSTDRRQHLVSLGPTVSVTASSDGRWIATSLRAGGRPRISRAALDRIDEITWSNDERPFDISDLVPDEQDPTSLWIMGWNEISRSSPDRATARRTTRYELAERGNSSASQIAPGVYCYQPEGGEARVVSLRGAVPPFALAGVTDPMGGIAITRDFHRALAWTDANTFYWPTTDKPGVAIGVGSPWAAATFFADKERAICATEDGGVELWVFTPTPRRVWRIVTGASAARWVTLGPDEKWAVINGGKGFAVLSTGGQVLHDVTPRSAWRCVDGGRILTVSAEAIDELTFDGSSFVRRRIDGDFASAVIAPDGEWAATLRHEQPPQVWLTNSAAAAIHLDDARGSKVLYPSPDSKILYTADRHRVLAWPIERDTQALRRQLWNATPYVLTVDQRRELLLETREEAEARHAAALAQAAEYHLPPEGFAQ